MKKPDGFKRYIPTLEDIYQIYKKYIEPMDVLEITRKRDVVENRLMFAMLCLKYTKESYANIGQFIKKDHSTIVHYTKQFDVIISSSPGVFENYLDAEKDIVNSYPYALDIFLNNPQKPDVKKAHILYLRKVHAFNVKLNFYKKLVYQQGKTTKKLNIELKNEKQLHKY